MTRRLFIFLMAILSVGKAGLTAGTSSLVLTAKENGLENQTDFVSTGRIHGYLRLPGPAMGPHLLEGIWTSPAGKIIAHSRTTVNFDPPGRSTAYLWLDFPERAGVLGSVDPQLDQERLSYDGDWRLAVRWDEKPLILTGFHVHCE